MVKSFTNQFLVALLSLVFSVAYGQKDVHLQINQYIGNLPFSIGDGGTNDLGTKFNVSRLDYYISSIKLHHDGGKTIDVNKYILVSKGNIVDEILGNFNISVLDSITFSVGVDYTNNHADPTMWPAVHPLAPKAPEMHWGWAAGYRFVAIEGKSGSNLQFSYQIHGLGDDLYNSTTIVTNGIDHNGAILVKLDADYKQSLKGINMNKNIIIHGSTNEAIPMLGNFNKYVFSATQQVSASHDIEVGELKVYPNPVSNGKATISLTESQTINARIIVRDGVGRIVDQISNTTIQNEIIIDNPGFYTIDLVQAGRLTYRGKLVKQ